MSKTVDLNRVDLNLLVAFDVLMEERSVTRAAERLSIGQSAMSSTLSRLRKLFQDPLLVRDGRCLTATPTAESLVEPVRDVMTRVQWVLSRPQTFDPARDDRTFSIITNDYTAITFLHPLLTRIEAQAPGVRLLISPAEDAVERLRHRKADLLITQREVLSLSVRVGEFSHEVLFDDRFVCAVDEDHPDVGAEITLEQFSTLPYLATTSSPLPSLAETQLDLLGVRRNTEVTARFGVAPFLLKGTRLVTLIDEMLANKVAGPAGLRLLDPPIPELRPITQIMVWTPGNDTDPGHQWLRQTLASLASEIRSGDHAGNAAPPCAADPTDGTA